MLKSEEWKPSTKLRDVLLALRQLMVEPNPDDPLRGDIADVYRKDRKQFESNVKDWIKKYCK
jgi:ubiquitin-conjugating enzyme E2 D/E